MVLMGGCSHFSHALGHRKLSFLGTGGEIEGIFYINALVSGFAIVSQIHKIHFISYGKSFFDGVMVLGAK